MMEPQEVLAVRHRSDGTAKGLIRWKHLPEYEDSWELLQELRRQFPASHLEDKVVVQGGSVRDRMHGLVYNRRRRREPPMGRE